MSASGLFFVVKPACPSIIAIALPLVIAFFIFSSVWKKASRSGHTAMALSPNLSKNDTFSLEVVARISYPQLLSLTPSAMSGWMSPREPRVRSATRGMVWIWFSFTKAFAE